MNFFQEFGNYFISFNYQQFFGDQFLIPFGMFFGAVVNATLGFGGAMIAYPLIAWALPIAVIAPLFNGMGLIQFFFGLPNEVNDGLKHKIIYPLVLGNIAGAVIGAIILINIQNNLLVKVIGGLILFFEYLYLVTSSSTPAPATIGIEKNSEVIDDPNWTYFFRHLPGLLA